MLSVSLYSNVNGWFTRIKDVNLKEETAESIINAIMDEDFETIRINLEEQGYLVSAFIDIADLRSAEIGAEQVVYQRMIKLQYQMNTTLLSKGL